MMHLQLIPLFLVPETKAEKPITCIHFFESSKKKVDERDVSPDSPPKNRQSEEACSDCDETYAGTSTEADSDVLSSSYSVSAKT